MIDLGVYPGTNTQYAVTESGEVHSYAMGKWSRSATFYGTRSVQVVVRLRDWVRLRLWDVIHCLMSTAGQPDPFEVKRYYMDSYDTRRGTPTIYVFPDKKMYNITCGEVGRHGGFHVCDEDQVCKVTSRIQNDVAESLIESWCKKGKENVGTE